MKLVAIDFEYNNTAEAKLNLVCCSLRVEKESKSFWLNDGSDLDSFLYNINLLASKGYTFLAYNVVAEASAFISANLQPLNFKWIDLYLEYRCLSNHNDNYAYGKQLIKGRVKTTKRPLPKWKRLTEEDEKKAESQKQEYGYGAAVFKALDIVIDSDFKNATRDLIISGDYEAIQANKDEIMRYCESDVVYLVPMFKQFWAEYKRLLGNKFNPDQLINDMKVRSEYSVRSAIMERYGYPIDVEKTKSFSSQVPNIIWECQTSVNNKLGLPIFRPLSKKKPFDLSWDQKLTRSLLHKWIKENNYKNWTLTDGGKKGIKDLSLSLKAFQKPISYRHDYPDTLIAQMQRYLKLKQGLNGFVEGTKKSDKRRFWDYVGSDGRVRPYMGIYGAQSARSQPSATSFIPLKAAWMRSLIAPTRGRCVVGIDYASQEFLLAALISGDDRMLEDYESGDVYLAFGKASGYIPKDGTKLTHKKERDECKAVVLGLSYDMSEYGLSFDLSEKFGRKVSPEEAITWIDKHKRVYRKFWAWKDKIQKDYKINRFLRLPDGWYMWGDNDNFRSIGNVPIQGFGSCIMRKAVQLAHNGGLNVIYTLHDAIYIECDLSALNSSIAGLSRCMDEAFRFYFPESVRPKATVRLDADAWGPDVDLTNNKYNLDYQTPIGTLTVPVKLQREYIDERAMDDYNTFSKYFDNTFSYDDLEF